MRRLIFTSHPRLLLTTQSAAIAGPFEKHRRCQDANRSPAAQSALDASTILPGYTGTTPAETTYYGQPSRPVPPCPSRGMRWKFHDPVCQAQCNA
jgi:hypothetical protein